MPVNSFCIWFKQLIYAATWQYTAMTNRSLATSAQNVSNKSGTWNTIRKSTISKVYRLNRMQSLMQIRDCVSSSMLKMRNRMAVSNKMKIRRNLCSCNQMASKIERPFCINATYVQMHTRKNAVFIDTSALMHQFIHAIFARRNSISSTILTNTCNHTRWQTTSVNSERAGQGMWQEHNKTSSLNGVYIVQSKSFFGLWIYTCWIRLAFTFDGLLNQTEWYILMDWMSREFPRLLTWKPVLKIV